MSNNGGGGGRFVLPLFTSVVFLVKFLFLSSSRSHSSLHRGTVAEVLGEKGDLPFVYTWKLERLSPSSWCSGRRWNYSHAFHAGGHSWKLALCPGEVKAEDGKCYYYLFLAVEDASSLLHDLDIEVTIESSILSGNDRHDSKKKVVYKFIGSKSEECYPFLMSLETLKCPSSGFLVVEIFDVIVRTEDENLSPKVENDSNVYTWIINGFSKLTKESYHSGPFLFNKHIWYLTLFPKGCKKDNFFSLYLELDGASTLPPTCKVETQVCLSWVDQINGQNCDQKLVHNFSSKSTSWGWPSFMSLDDLHAPSKGFLVNDSCTIKVTVPT